MAEHECSERGRGPKSAEHKVEAVTVETFSGGLKRPRKETRCKYDHDERRTFHKFGRGWDRRLPRGGVQG